MKSFWHHPFYFISDSPYKIYRGRRDDFNERPRLGTAYWPRSHLANHRYFLAHPELFDGSVRRQPKTAHEGKLTKVVGQR